MRRWHVAQVVLPVLAAGAVLLFAGCAALRKDAVDVADVCKPEVLPDALEALPYVIAAASCAINGGDCSVATADLEAIGKADATRCALAELHAATVKLAADGGAP